ncbi:2-aminoethylphosphonate--pyruvate transaminase [Akkermansia sp. N21116]|uniref:2-aminoethylphosphonate--pyruvate transaminase n=1 Tax=Akkermansia sp. N21116 TaxID=3040764 RepID=UPI00244ECE13|nr:2-aminoethylphosphonate--pyruvate transaminase [Akkermansia sp. N21116]WPX40533.1 2-aminoethylphosphonate--pyruvate transaminase [Akkermansia sp. N21116]
MRNYLLLTPGPLSTSPSVREAMLQDWCTWDKDYNEGIVSVIRQELLRITGLDNSYTSVLLQGSGTYSVEAVLGSAVKPEDKLLIVSNGAYGKRMGDIARYHGLNYAIISLKETLQVTADVVLKALVEHPDTTHLAMVHCETTTGIINPIEEVAKAIEGHELTFIVDAMSSFGGIPIDIDGLNIDFLISSANKCIQGVPGFGFIIAKRTKIESCKGTSRSLSLDIYDQWNEMEKGHGKWRFTSPTHVVRAFFQALKELNDEGGIAARHQRYRENHSILVEGMERLGFKALLPADVQSPIITSFLYPEKDFDFPAFYEALKQRGFVIYPGKISEAPTFRIGNIGDVFPEDFERLVDQVAAIRGNKTR